jgi:hypothetical protein
MAQTKRKRRTKHRGNAAGVVESRGRTGRKPTEDERKAATKKAAAQSRLERPPSWRSAANKAALAAGLFAVIIIVLFKEPASRAISLAGFMLLLYIPLGYYTDKFIYDRRMRKKASGG